jgi:3-dehydroquinate synthase
MRPLLVLVGPPGAGKSTVGRLAAELLDVGFRDTDLDIVRAVGKPISEVFVDDGEEHFRELERAAVATALAEHDGVLSLGGGAVLSPETRALLRDHRVVLLEADLGTATSRVGLNRDRPVLALNPRAVLKVLLEQRLPLYREVATDVVSTNGKVGGAPSPTSCWPCWRCRSPSSARVSEPTRITVRGARPYDVVIGEGLLGELDELLHRSTRVAVVHPASLRETAEAVRADLESSGRQAHAVEVPTARRRRTSRSRPTSWDVLGQVGFTRTDALVGVGGGATTDLTGFVAATWLRGVPVVHVPTTLLAGRRGRGGKTGINTAAGKNLVGAFHPPAGVVCDLTALQTMPKHDYVAGLAEVVKVGFTHDPRILELVEQDPKAAQSPSGPHTRELVERAVAVKAAVVGDDLTEQGSREFLNYGHTLGPRHREGRGLPLAPRRRRVGRARLRRRARPARRDGSTTRPPPATAACSSRSGCRPRTPATGSSCAPPWRSTRSRAATGCASSSSTRSPAPASSRTRTRGCSSPPTRRSGATADPRSTCRTLGTTAAGRAVPHPPSA